ncbi:MAG: hypothetical protein AB7I38_16755 [Dehalococcoidia bacterium]
MSSHSRLQTITSSSPLDLIPSEWTDPRIGIEDPALSYLTRLALSRLIGPMEGSKANVGMTAWALQVLGSHPLELEEGHRPRPMWTDPIAHRAAPAALALCGMSVKQINDLWKKEESTNRRHAVLPAAVVCSFFPAGGAKLRQTRGALPELTYRVEVVGGTDGTGSAGSYPALCADLLQMGPERAHELFWSALEVYATVRVRTGPRAGQPPGAATLSTLHAAFCRLTTAFGALAAGGGVKVPGSSGVDACLPQWRDPRARRSKSDIVALCRADDRGRTDRNGPPVLVVRRALRRADDVVQVLKKADRGTEQGGRGRLVAALRDRVLLGLLAVVGSREGALFVDHDQHPVTVASYDPAHEFRVPGIGEPVTLPAYCIYAARKGGLRLKPMWVGLPQDLAAWLEEYLELAGIADRPDHPLWITSRRVGESSSCTNLKLRSLDPIIKRLLGSVRGGGAFSPHTLRHSPGEPVARRVGDEWLGGRLDNSVVGLPAAFAEPLDDTDRGRLRYGRTIADALLSHSFSREDTNGYLNLEDHRERLATVATFGIWANVWGPLSCETEPDLDLIGEAKERLLGARNDVERLELRIAEKEREIRVAEEELEAAIPDLEREAKLDFVLLHQSRMGRLNREHAALLRSTSDCTAALAKAEAELEAALAVRRAVPDRWIPQLSDDATVSTVEATAMLLAATGKLLHTASVVARLRRAGCVEMNTERQRRTPLAWRFGDVFQHLIQAADEWPGRRGAPVEEAFTAADALDEDRPRTLRERLEEALEVRNPMAQAEAALAFYGPAVSPATIKRAMNGQTRTSPFQSGRRPDASTETSQPRCVVGEPGSRNRRVLITGELTSWLLEHPRHCEFAIAILMAPEGTHVADYAAGRRRPRDPAM